MTLNPTFRSRAYKRILDELYKHSVSVNKYAIELLIVENNRMHGSYSVGFIQEGTVHVSSKAQNLWDHKLPLHAELFEKGFAVTKEKKRLYLSKCRTGAYLTRCLNLASSSGDVAIALPPLLFELLEKETIDYCNKGTTFLTVQQLNDFHNENMEALQLVKEQILLNMMLR